MTDLSLTSTTRTIGVGMTNTQPPPAGGGKVRLTKAQRFVLAWLSQDDWSLYGECKGGDLDYLMAQGLARPAHIPPTDRTGVEITPAGRAALASETKP